MTTEEFNRLTINEIINRFTEWKKLVDEEASIDELKKAVFSLITGCGFMTISADKGKLYRARKNSNDNFFTHVSELNYPQKHLVKNMGRANRKNESIMYLAQHGSTALFEINAELNDYITVSEWEIKEKLNLMFISSSEVSNISSLSNIINNKDSQFRGTNYNQQGIENINFIHRLLHEEFIRPDNDNPEKTYKLSTAIAETLLDYKEADGLIYPSVKSKNDLNIVLKPKSADNKIKITRCDILKITERVNSDLTFLHLYKRSKIDYQTGEIIWFDSKESGLDWPTLEKVDSPAANSGFEQVGV